MVQKLPWVCRIDSQLIGCSIRSGTFSSDLNPVLPSNLIQYSGETPFLSLNPHLLLFFFFSFWSNPLPLFLSPATLFTGSSFVSSENQELYSLRQVHRQAREERMGDSYRRRRERVSVSVSYPILIYPQVISNPTNISIG